VKISLPVLGPIDDVIYPTGTGPNTPHTAVKGVDESDHTPSAHTSDTMAVSSKGVGLYYSSACSAHDVPTPQTITLSPTQRVTRVSIRCSSAVEGVSFTIRDIDSDIDTGCNNSSRERLKGEKGTEDESYKNEVSSSGRERRGGGREEMEGKRRDGKGGEKEEKGREGREERERERRGGEGCPISCGLTRALSNLHTFSPTVTLFLARFIFVSISCPSSFHFFVSVFAFVSPYSPLLSSLPFSFQRIHCYGRTEGGREIHFKVPEGWAFIGLCGRTGDNLQTLGVAIKKVKVCEVVGEAVDVVVGCEEQDTGVKGSETGERVPSCVRICE
jgi:hypothetical protein